MIAHEFPRDKSIYDNYVCPKCFYTMDKCECKIFPHYSITWIDKGIQEIIRILNSKGYMTQYSCESHTPQDNLYIAFYYGYGFGKTLPAPEGFKIKSSGRTIEHLYGKDSRARKKMTAEEFEAEKKECLDNLLEWAKALPEQADRNKKFSW